MNTLENETKDVTNFFLQLELEKLSVNGILNIEKTQYNKNNSCWNGNKFTIPVYGLYKISWGFYQNALETFYNNTETELSLIINSDIHEEKAVINRQTTSIYAEKSSHKTVTILLRENETISLRAAILNKENPKMKDIYFRIEKLETEENLKFSY